VPSRIAMKRVLEQDPSLPDVAQISATCDVDTVPLPSPAVLPPVPPPDPLLAMVAPPVPPVVVLVKAGVETFTETLADADEFDVLAPIPASEAAVPLPVALAPVPAPVLLAEALPFANASVVAVPAPVSTEASEPELASALAEAEPSPVELADTPTLADEDAEALPSVLVIAPSAVAAADPPMTPPPVVSTPMSANAEEDEAAEESPAKVALAPSADALPLAVPSSVDVPLRLADSVELSAVFELAPAVPAAVAPTPTVVRSTDAFTAPFEATPVPPSLDAVTSPASPPVAPALVDDEESEVLPAPSSPCAVAPPLADAEAPVPLALASECDDVDALPPPTFEWLSDEALAEAARAAVDVSQPVCEFGAIGAAVSMRAKALVESASPSLNRRGLFIWVLLQQECLNGVLLVEMYRSGFRAQQSRAPSREGGRNKAPTLCAGRVIWGRSCVIEVARPPASATLARLWQ
jgi:hypothetical protein